MAVPFVVGFASIVRIAPTAHIRWLTDSSVVNGPLPDQDGDMPTRRPGDGRRSGTASTPVVGRSRELDQLGASLDRLAAGEGGVVLVEGEPGIGKTSVLDHIVECAEVRSLVVLRGTGDDLDQDRPFALLQQALAVELPTLAAPTELARERTDASFVVIEHLLDELDRRASIAPVLLALDDVQWADTASLRALRSIVRRRAHAPVLTYLSFRPQPRPPELVRLLDDVAASGGRPLRLEGLATADLHQLVVDVLAGDAPDGLAAHLERAGGNPFYAIELARCLVADGSAADAGVEAVPDDVRLAVLRRISALTASTLELLKVASVLGTRFTATELAAVSGRSAATLLPAVDDAVAGLVLHSQGDHLAFRHDLIRDSLYAEIPQSVRRAMHRDVATALAHTGAAPERVAQHLLVGATHGDAFAVAWLRDAAREAARRSWTIAADLFRHAFDLASPDDPARPELASELADALLRAGRPIEADEVIDRALVEGGDEVALRTTRIANTIHLGRPADAIAEGEILLALPSVPLEQRVSVQALVVVQKAMSGDLAGAAAGVEAVVAGAEAVEDAYAMSVALQARAVVRQSQGLVHQAVADAERAVAIGRTVPPQRTGFVTAFFLAGIVLCDTDRFDDAVRVLDEGRRRAEAAGLTTWLPMLHWAGSAAHIAVGELDDALTQAETSISLAEELPKDLPMPAPAHVLAAAVALHRDRLADARASASAARRVLESARSLLGIDLAFWIEALILEASGDVEGAAATVATAWDLLEPMPHFPTRRMIAPDAVRLLRDHEPRRAARIAAHVTELAQLVPDVPSIAATAMRCRGLLEDDAPLLRAAAATLAATPRRLDAVLSSLDAADALGRHGERTEAIALLEAALPLAEQMGADRIVARVYAALRAMGVRRRAGGPVARQRTGWESLSPTERKVVSLVAEGLSNREVGERLFISRRTVETHLSHVFAKLGLSSRAAVASAAARVAGER